MAVVLQIASGDLFGVSDVLADFLAGDSPYRITSWTPAVGQRRNSDNTIDDVTERMTISVRSDNPYAAVQALASALQQATAWGNGDEGPGVFLRYKLYSASATMLSSFITGPAGNAPMVVLPPGFNIATATDHIDGVVLTFRRSGVWLIDGEPLGGPDTDTTANPLVGSVTFRNAFESPAPAPFGIGLHCGASEFVPFKSYVLAATGVTEAEAKARLFVINAESMASGGYSSANDTDALNGKVLKGNGATVAQTSMYDISASTTSNSEEWAVFVNAKTGDSTTKYQLSIWMNSQRGAFQTRPFIIDRNQQWRYVGNVSVKGKAIGIGMGDASRLSGSGDLAIDSIVLLATTNGNGRAVYISDNQTAKGLYINADFNIRQFPTVTAYKGAGDPYDINVYRGDPGLVAPPGHHGLAVSFLSNQRHAGGTRWRSIDQAGNATSLTISAYPNAVAYFTPE